MRKALIATCGAVLALAVGWVGWCTFSQSAVATVAVLDASSPLEPFSTEEFTPGEESIGFAQFMLPADAKGDCQLTLHTHWITWPLSLERIEINDLPHPAQTLEFRLEPHRTRITLPPGSLQAGRNLLTFYFSRSDEAGQITSVTLRNYREPVRGVWLLAPGWGRFATPAPELFPLLWSVLIGLSCWGSLLCLRYRTWWSFGPSLMAVLATHLWVPGLLWACDMSGYQTFVRVKTLNVLVVLGTLLPALLGISLTLIRSRFGPLHLVAKSMFQSFERWAQAAFQPPPDGTRRVRWLSESLFLAVILLLPDAVALCQGRSILVADTLTSNLPLKALAMEQLGRGELPLWTSKLGCGSPLLADSITMPFDWRGFWWFLLPAPLAYWAMLATSRVLGGLICHYYFRIRHGFGFGASATATLVYFCGTVYFGEARLHSTGVILEGFPLIIWLTERLLDRPGWKPCLALGLGWAMLFLMGSVAYLAYLPVLAGVWALGLWWCQDRSQKPGVRGQESGVRSQRSWGHLVRFGLAYGASGLWALAVCGVTLLPFVELVTLSNRGGEYPIDPFAFRGLWFALFGSHSMSDLVPGSHQFFYVGVIALPLIAFSLTRRDHAYLRMLPWLAGITLAGLLVMTSPLKPMLVRVLPMLATVSFFRLTFFWGFQAALLVGFALNQTTWQPTVWVRRLTWGLYALQLGAILALPLLAGWMMMFYFEVPHGLAKVWQLAAPFVLGTFFLLVAIRLWGLRRAAGLNPADHTPRSTAQIGIPLLLELAAVWVVTMSSRGNGTKLPLFPETPEVAVLKQQADPNYRSIQIIASQKRGNETLDGTYEALTSLYLDAQAYHGLHSANIYESLVIRDFSRFMENFADLDDRRRLFPRATNAVMTTSTYDSPLLDALAVRYLITQQPFPPSKDRPKLVRGTSYYVYERRDAMPRAYFVENAEYLPEQDVHDRLLAIAVGEESPELLKQSVLIVTNETRAPLSEAEHLAQVVARLPIAPMREGPISLASLQTTFVPARITRDVDREVSIEVESPTRGHLVLTDTYYPGWKAWVDDVETPIQRANGYARAVPVEAGKHTVRFRYEPASVVWGKRLTICSAGATVLFIAVMWWRKKRKAVTEPALSGLLDRAAA